MRCRSGRLLLLAAIATVAGCAGSGSDSTTSPAVAALVLSAFDGDAQTGIAGQVLANGPAVKATRNAVPAAGVAVTFAVASGGGSLASATVTTDGSGVARAAWTLGPIVGANSLSATAQGAPPVTFTATSRSGAAAAMVKSGGDALTGAAGVALTGKPAVKVTDAFGNIVAGHNVTFAVAGGGGSVTGGTQATAGDGLAAVGAWTLGNLIGANTLTATASGSGITGNPQTFSATGVAGAVASLTKIAGDDQRDFATILLPIAPSVRLADQFGNLVANQSVTFAVLAGAGAITGATQTSASNGIASVGGWTLGPTPGVNTLSATAGAVTVLFTATGKVAFNASQYAGTYTGVWNNTTFGSTGTASATFTVTAAGAGAGANAATGLATLSVVVTGPVLGGSGGTSTTQSAAYAQGGWLLSNVIVPVLGRVTFQVGHEGFVEASATNIPNPAILSWTAEGTVVGSQIRLTFVVRFNDGSTAIGTINLNRP